ncbi:hypothetical protein SISNIDRAFT_499010 [Sistotremastrum niveocremeum HHB9708]|uniref:Zn(2)-C6 fungal-type domain-containing protein n=1 Tax=Sistotremastrum niveocremeum HHB9708 TaxID=1314777 RepID=A0A165ACF3_9AGAM|nr:hypothetical protein SISNIDRAFT_499010 [Sistotremastrum niveocremeum HHB9708]
MDPTPQSPKAAYPLQRGSACLSCRSVLIKCDATKPVCHQCLKANRGDECEYDDGKSKSRTQMLQDKMAKLQERIREASHPQRTTFVHRVSSLPARGFPAAPTKAQFTSCFRSSSSSNSSESPAPIGSDWGGDSLHPTPFDLQPASIDPLIDSWDINGMPFPTGPSPAQWWQSESLTPPMRQKLFDIFFAHRHQCAFEVHIPRFLASINGPPKQAPHPTLLNAIYLLACHFSHQPPLIQHEALFLERALSRLAEALERSDRLINVIQASCLLATYFFGKGRLLEGYYHASSASRLAVGLGLHQIRSQEFRNIVGEGGPDDVSTWNNAVTGGILPVPDDAIELGERILAFWQVFNIDRCWAVATGLPSGLADDDHPRTMIETVWPRDIEDFERGQIFDADYATVRSLFLPNPAPTMYGRMDSLSTLRAKATTLFERASRLSANFDPDHFWKEFRTLEGAIVQFQTSLPKIRSTPRNSMHSSNPTTAHCLMAVHTLTMVATIQLHHSFAASDPPAQQRCFDAAMSCVSIIADMADEDYEYLDPIMGTCWMCVSDVLIREITRRQALGGGHEQGAAAMLRTVIQAMHRLSRVFPLAGYQATKVEQSRPLTAF